MNKSIKEKVIEILRHQLGLPHEKEILESSNVFKDLGADSLDIISIQVILEDEFNIKIPDSYFETIYPEYFTVKYIIDCIQLSMSCLSDEHITDSPVKKEKELIQIDLSDDVFMRIAMEAHQRDITFNEMVNIILREATYENNNTRS
ncbi:MAG: phosphopantetheine-binding protein [bacterium]